MNEALKRVVCIFSLALASCSSSGSSTTPAAKETYEYDELDFTSSEDDFEDPEEVTLPDGSIESKGDDVDVTISGVTHKVLIDESYPPVWEIETEPAKDKLPDMAKPTKAIVSVTDTVTQEKVTFSFDLTTNKVTMTVGAEEITILRNTDGSYTVNGMPAANGKAAVAILNGVPGFTSASPFAVLQAYDEAQAPPSNATGAAFCAPFKDLCDCVACSAAKKTDCALCR